MVSDTGAHTPTDNRRYVLLKKRQGLSRAEMLDYWRHVHAPLVIPMPEFWRYTSRYVQNHVIDDTAGGEGAFDGVVETWQRDRPNPFSLFADEAVYRGPVREDEPKFLSMPETVATLTRVQIVIDGPESGWKMLSFIRRRPELSHEEFAEGWARYAGLIRGSSAFREGPIRFVQCLCIPQMERGFAGEKPVYGIDGVADFRFASQQDMEAAFASEEYRTLIQPAEQALFLNQTRLHVQEIEIHQPT